MVPFKSQEAFASDYFEDSLLVLSADITAVNADRQRPIGSGKLVPDVLTTLDETELLLTQFPLQALRDIRDVLANGEGIEGFVDRQHLLQEFRRHPVTHERGPLGLQEKQFR